ncbi:MAG: gliding motility-associated protein GldE [Proteiniphilum sp.]|nr:gliding motility-associated protein GldE [Proteiniphilum sp.]
MALDIGIIVFIIILLIVNAMTSGFEIAFFSLSKEQIKEIRSQSNSKEKKIDKLVNNPEKLISSILVSNGFFNVLSVLLAIYLSLQYTQSLLSISIIIAVVAVIIVLFTDIIPKAYATQKPLQFVKGSVHVVDFINKLMTPFSYVLTKTINIFSRSSIEKKYDISLDDLSKALELTSEDTERNNEMEMLEGIIRFRNKTAEDIMISRTDMVSLDIQTNFTEVIKYIVAAGFSRIPVYEDNPDNIKGILYVKDLLPNLDKNEVFRWQSLIRSAYFVPGTKRIDDLLEEFRANKNHMAILIDEYGGTMGIVTMEDILEEIVGDISDEYDEDEQPFYYIAPDGSYVFEGKTSLEDFIEATGVSKKDFEKIREDVDTIAGLMLELKGDFPKRKETINYLEYSFQAEEVSKRRVLKVRFNKSNIRKKNV